MPQVSHWRTRWAVPALILTALAQDAVAAASGRINVVVLDRDGMPVPEVAVYALPEAGTPTPDETSGLSATMDQRGLAFVPHVLVVRTGTAIGFPNSDDVLHHVYSFSPVKRFELPLYAGTLHPPLVFDEPGLVTLGCNIHDEMVGYILVVDTPHFALTNEHGAVQLDGLAAGAYRVQIWTPRQRPTRMPDPVTVSVEPTAQTLTFQFDQKLYPPHEHSETSLLWSNY